MTSLHDSQRMPGLDGVRGIACLTVVISHSANVGFLPSILGKGAGQFGVMLFFALSGFLMAALYAKRELSQTEAVKYVIARLARIYPLYFTAILISYLIYSFVDSGFIFQMSFDQLLKHAGLFGYIDIFWTIPTEMQFYVYFLVIWFVLSRFRYGLHVFILLTLAQLSVLVLPTPNYPGPFYSVISKIHFFLAGAGAAIIFQNYATRLRARVTGYELPVLFIIYVLVWPGISRKLFGVSGDIWREEAFAILMALIVLFAAMEKGKLSAVLRSGVFRWLGEVSFAMYLVHRPILDYAMRLHVHGKVPLYVAYGCFWVVLFILVHVSLNYLEKPTRRWINNWGEMTAIPYFKRFKSLVKIQKGCD